MNKSTTQYMKGDKLTCPNCGKMEFCIGIDDIWTDGKELYADCTNCLCSTLVSLLKKRYHKDIEKDFDSDGTEMVTITLECTICGKIKKLAGKFRLFHYFGTMYNKFEPDPENWKCPDHPESVVNMLIDTELDNSG